MSDKIDHRKGTRPVDRKLKSQNSIRKALKDGRKKFGELLLRTHLSRPTLASNLNEMKNNKEVKRWRDPQDRRVVYYSLDTNGLEELRREDQLEAFKSRRALSPSDIPEARFAYLPSQLDLLVAIKIFTENFVDAVRSAGLAPFESKFKDYKSLTKNIALRVYTYEPTEKEAIKTYIRELEESATSARLPKHIDLQSLENVPNFGFSFEFSINKFIEEYLKKIKDEYYHVH